MVTVIVGYQRTAATCRRGGEMSFNAKMGRCSCGTPCVAFNLMTDCTGARETTILFKGKILICGTHSLLFMSHFYHILRLHCQQAWGSMSTKHGTHEFRPSNSFLSLLFPRNASCFNGRVCRVSTALSSLKAASSYWLEILSTWS